MHRRAWQPLLAADDVAHLHQVVVNDVGQVIGGQVVGALVEHFVVEDGAGDGDVAADEVMDGDVAARLDFEAHHILCALVDEALHLVGRHGERVAHLQACGGVILEVGHLGAPGVEFVGRVKGDVGAARVEQLLDVDAIDVAALALLVGAVGATLAHTLVDADAQPVEGLVDVVLGAGHKARAVGVLDAQYHRAAVLASKQVVI